MKILVIDDEPLIHISIERLVQKYCDTLEVFHAYNGQEMQNLLQMHDFLLAYVDIKLPGISGLEAIRLGKEISPNTTYYIMTGYDSFEYAKEAIKLKVEDYLIKQSILARIPVHRRFMIPINESKNLYSAIGWKVY